MKYVIVSTAVTDKTYQYGRTTPTINLGGAGTYALAGVKIWTDEVTLVTGVGADFASVHGKWFEENGLVMDQLQVKDEKTPTTIVKYFEDGERKETPAFGTNHYRLMEATVDDIQATLHSDVKGVYIFKEADLEFWYAVSQLKQNHRFTLMWEINADSAVFDQIAHVKGIAEKVDIFSINRTEAHSLLHKESINEMITEFKSWNTPLIFLRDGARGAYMIYEDECVHVPPVKNAKVVDATGGGNSSSAGVLYGVCEGYSPYDSGVIGSISASVCLEQQGVPQHLDSEIRKRANELLQDMRWK
ncbi:PfkB family carbohydrate kinase [Bacillus sp. FJAT-50079]|uniref:carbohydrate kinase family protein n=1 Tax=Bacillus sp. FJAT-50079 TaxID=2833577 RepID=UPI001BC9F75E|nr:PfkB family carbohydrate kinase [Bacillus sp. FJAT-50079]MBS4208905.1 hypothetical protein [Bacillus sp. FJAT-50079]